MSEQNPNARLEAFCDGVFAFALTLLIVDIKIPSSAAVNSTTEFWSELGHLLPALFAFLLSFVVILITWVNHHGSLELVNKSSASFIYANALLLLSVVFVPFPTALLGNYLLTDHAAPAVILYDSTLALQATGWILMTSAALRDELLKNEQSASTMRRNRNFGIIAFIVYVLLAVLAIWFPLAIALLTTLIWVLWLIRGINLKHQLAKPTDYD